MPPLGFLSAQLASRFEAELFAELRRSGFPDLRPRHSALLTALEPAGARLTALADRSGVTPQAMGELVDDLEKKGYLSRTPDPTDRRARLIVFTERGLRALDECLAVVARIEAQQMAAIGAAQYDEVRRILGELLNTPTAG